MGWCRGGGKWGCHCIFILRTTDGGATWTEQASPANQPLQDVFFTSASTGTAVGYDSSIVHTTDGGATWTRQSTGGVGIYATGVCFTDSNNGTVVGWPYSGGPGIILQTSDGGTTWTSRAIGTLFSLNGVSFADVRNGMVVGEHGTILQTSDGGSSWVNLSPGTRADLECVSFANSMTGVVVGRGTMSVEQTDGSMFRTIDGGVNWSLALSRPNSWYHGVCFADAMQGTAVGWEYQGPYGWTMNGIVTRTTDGGISWEDKVILGETLLYAVHFSDSNRGTIVLGGRTFALDSILFKGVRNNRRDGDVSPSIDRRQQILPARVPWCNNPLFTH